MASSERIRMEVKRPAAERPRVRESEPIRGTIALTAATVARLQRTVGNAAVTRLLEDERRRPVVARSRESAQPAMRPRLLARSPDQQKVKARAYELWQRQGARPTSQEEADANYFEALREIEIEERAHRLAEERGGGDPVANYYEAERQIVAEHTSGDRSATPVPVDQASAPSSVPTAPSLNINAPSFVPKSASPTVKAPAFNVNAPSFVPKSAAPTVSAPSSTPSAPSIVPMHAPQATLPPIGINSFTACQEAGRLTMRAVKWWSSANFPNHNIEIALQVDGRPWAIAHVKWKDRNDPTEENVEMATFKDATGQSIYGGNIWSGTTLDLLVAEALNHTKALKAQQPLPGKDVKL